MNLQEEINREVLKRADFDGVAKAVMSGLDFDEMKRKITEEFNAPYRSRSRIEVMIEESLVREFVKRHADEILAQLNMDAIVSAVTYKVATAVKERLDG